MVETANIEQYFALEIIWWEIELFQALKKKTKSMFQFKVDIYKFYFLLFVKMRVLIFGDDRIFWTYLVGLCL